MNSPDSPSSSGRLFAALVAIVCLSYLAAQLTLPVLDTHLGVLALNVVEAALIAVASGLGLWFGVFRRLRAQARAEDFRSRVARAVQMASTESAVHDVVRRAIAQVAPGCGASLMLADSSEAHLKVVAEHAPSGSVTGCGVTAPFDCPAVRSAQTRRFPDPRALDACPFLLTRPGDEGAVCVPLNTVGRSIGVLHVIAPARQLPAQRGVTALESLSEQASSRLGLLRVMEQTHLQAATDPLTGLLNRRSLENHARAMVTGERPFSLAMGDLDHFKKLNDTHGHDAGDRALRLFARCVRAGLRAEDLVSRYGGEEFVLILPGLSAPQAANALERVQEQLRGALAAGGAAPFTASWGLAHSSQASSLEELTRLADVALFRAKREGRNRIVVEGASDSEAAGEPPAPAAVLQPVIGRAAAAEDVEDHSAAS